MKEPPEMEFHDELNPPPVGEQDAPANGARRRKPPPRPADGPVESELQWSLRFVAEHGDDLRHVWKWQKWFCWDGRRWNPDAQDEPRRRAKETARRQTLVAEALGRDSEFLRIARAAESNRGIEATLRLAASDRAVAVDHEIFDTDPLLLAVENGAVDLRTGELRPHRREDYLTRIAPVTYDPEAPAPTWERFVREILPDDNVRGFVQRYSGYALTGDVGEQVLAFFHGEGANGKSTYLEVLLGLLGDYATQAPPDILIAKRNEPHPTELTVLHSRRLACCIETQEGRRLNEVRVKLLTGGDRITARRMREDFWTFTPTHKLILGANHKPKVRGTDEAIWRRILLVPFTVTIPRERRDKQLSAKLLAEGPGILAWLVRGCLEWRERGLDAPDAVLAATDAYRAEEDRVGAFLVEACAQGPTEMVAKGKLFDAYKVWSETAGEPAMTKRAFGEELIRRGFAEGEIGKANTRCWIELGLKEGG